MRETCNKTITIISPAWPLRGGISASSERLARVLEEQGHSVELLSYSLQYPGFLFPGKTQYSDDPAPQGLSINTKLNSINPFNWFWTGYWLGKKAPDVVIVRFWLPFMGPALGTVLRIARFFSPKKMRIMALVDNIIPHEKRMGDRFFARYFARVCDAFTVMSTSVQEEIKPFSGTKPVYYAPHPVYDIYGDKIDRNVARKTLELPANLPLVLFFGLIRDYKGLDILLDALADPSCARLGVCALIAGECYGDWAPYASQIARNELDDRVFLHVRYIPNAEVNHFFSAANLVVQPYKSATQSGISQIAYHFDCPMVVTQVGGLPEIVTHGKSGYVVAPEPGAVAQAIVDYFSENREKEMSQKVAEQKRIFSWENLARTVLK